MQAEFAHVARVSMLGELTASIAHEVNQPLGAILTSGETAIRWLDRPEPNLGELRALAARTVSDARRAGEVIRRIRSMASNGEPELVALALNDVVEEVMIFLGPELKRQAVRATLDLAPGLPSVRGDRVQLQQVLANLAVNALQAMAGQAQPRLLIRTAMTDPRTVCAVVEDNGPGIPPDQLHRLFQSFFTTKKGGMASASRSADRSWKRTAAGWKQSTCRAALGRDSGSRCLHSQMRAYNRPVCRTGTRTLNTGSDQDCDPRA